MFLNNELGPLYCFKFVILDQQEYEHELEKGGKKATVALLLNFPLFPVTTVSAAPAALLELLHAGGPSPVRCCIS